MVTGHVSCTVRSPSAQYVYRTRARMKPSEEARASPPRHVLVDAFVLVAGTHDVCSRISIVLGQLAWVTRNIPRPQQEGGVQPNLLGIVSPPPPQLVPTAK